MMVALVALAALLPVQEPVDHGKAWIGIEAKFEAVENEKGETVALGEVFGSRPVVLVFYRGVW
ncbi:MAG: hypothetical protein AB7F50_11730 [Fimbriimonadaceae bacterium]